MYSRLWCACVKLLPAIRAAATYTEFECSIKVQSLQHLFQMLETLQETLQDVMAQGMKTPQPWLKEERYLHNLLSATRF